MITPEQRELIISERKKMVDDLTQKQKRVMKRLFQVAMSPKIENRDSSFAIKLCHFNIRWVIYARSLEFEKLKIVSQPIPPAFPVGGIVFEPKNHE